MNGFKRRLQVVQWVGRTLTVDRTGQLDDRTSQSGSDALRSTPKVNPSSILLLIFQLTSSHPC
jgi:hypothetical protein